MLKLMKIQILTAVIIFVMGCLDVLNPGEEEESANQVNLTGKVYDKDSKPVSMAIATLKKMGISDTTLEDGSYQLISDLSAPIQDDTLVITKDGQLLDIQVISNFVDDLPAIYIVQRDIYGEFFADPFGEAAAIHKIEALLMDEAEAPLKTVELGHNAAANAFSGFIYTKKSMGGEKYILIVNIYRANGELIGTSEVVPFTDMLGDIKVPMFEPKNNLLSIEIDSIYAVAGHETWINVRVPYYYQTRIVRWEWDIGNSGQLVEKALRDTSFYGAMMSDNEVLIPVGATQLECRVRVTDVDGNQKTRSFVITANKDIPEARIQFDMFPMLLPGMTQDSLYVIYTEDSYKLVSMSYPGVYGKIVRQEWSIGSLNNFVDCSTIDTVIVIQEVHDSLPIVLRVTNDNGEMDTDTLYIKVKKGTAKPMDSTWIAPDTMMPPYITPPMPVPLPVPYSDSQSYDTTYKQDSLLSDGWNPVYSLEEDVMNLTHLSLGLGLMDVPFLFRMSGTPMLETSILTHNQNTWNPATIVNFPNEYSSKVDFFISPDHGMYAALITDEDTMVNNNPSKYYEVKVLKYNGASWNVAGNVNTEAFSHSTYHDFLDINIEVGGNGVVYVSFWIGLKNMQTSRGSTRMRVYKLNGNKLEPMGTELFADTLSAYLCLKVDNRDIPYIAYADGAHDYRLTVKKFNNTDWELVGVRGFSNGSVGDANMTAVMSYPRSGLIELAFDKENMPYIAFIEKGVLGGLRVMQYIAGWGQVGPGYVVDGYTSDFALAIGADNHVYLADGEVTVRKYDTANWKTVDAYKVSQGNGSHVSLVINENNKAFVGYYDDMSRKVMVKTKELK
ncbi:MAG: hypothetical protein HQK83_03230 [Fibrobacteria bacterium]|nr:hypothetical protein [Fibrobacteria bacterium]